MKKTIIFYLSFVFVFVIIVLSSCTTTKYYSYSLQDQYNKEWVGKSRKNVIDNCGAPNRTVDAGNGNLILVYEDISVSAFSTNIGGYDIGSANRNRSFVEFYLDRNGKCYQVKTNHRGQYSRKEKVSFGEWLKHTFR